MIQAHAEDPCAPSMLLAMAMCESLGGVAPMSHPTLLLGGDSPLMFLKGEEGGCALR